MLRRLHRLVDLRHKIICIPLDREVRMATATIKVFDDINKAALYAKQQISMPGTRVAVTDKVDDIDLSYKDANGTQHAEPLPAAGGRWVVMVF